MEFLRITGLSILSGGLAAAVALLVGVTLLELPYSLPFAGASWRRGPPPVTLLQSAALRPPPSAHPPPSRPPRPAPQCA